MTAETAMRSPKLWKRLLIAIIIGTAFWTLYLYFREGRKRDGLAVQYISLTNYPGMRQPTALFAMTNLVRAAVNITYLVEVKTAEWPIYGPDMEAKWYSHGMLPANAVTTLAIHVPDYGSAWRARVFYGQRLTKWDALRSSSAAFLHAHKLHGLARFIHPPPASSILLPEMKVFTEPTPDLRRKVEASYSQLEPTRVFEGCKVAEDENGMIVRVYSQSRERPGVEPPPFQMWRFDSGTGVLSALTDQEFAR